QKIVQYTLENLPESWQNIDILINNAGLAKGFSPIHEGDTDHWETMIDTNIKGLLYVTRAISPGMVERRRGHIINICSSAGKEVYANGNVYCATKFAVDALTRSMRLDLHQHNIRVSQVSPGHVEDTEFALNRFDGDQEQAQIYNNFQPLRPEDVADVIYYMTTRPAHVNVQDVVLFSTQQASATVVDRSGRKE
ncbi:MAG: SDR family NAD(P)-dependent oxidoreductase, partial [Saprospiraceae bacterium]